MSWSGDRLSLWLVLMEIHLRCSWHTPYLIWVASSLPHEHFLGILSGQCIILDWSYAHRSWGAYERLSAVVSLGRFLSDTWYPKQSKMQCADRWHDQISKGLLSAILTVHHSIRWRKEQVHHQSENMTKSEINVDRSFGSGRCLRTLWTYDPSSSDGISRASILGVEPFCLKHRSLVHETWSEIIWQSVPLGQVDQ